MTITEVRQANPDFFTPENKMFHRDVSYSVRKGQRWGIWHFVRATHGVGHGLLGQKQPLHYQYHPINPRTCEILFMFKGSCATLKELNDWLKTEG